MYVKVVFPASGLSCSGRRGGTSVFCSKWSYKNHHQKEWQGAQVGWARISLVGKQPDDHTDSVCLTGKHVCQLQRFVQAWKLRSALLVTVCFVQCYLQLSLSKVFPSCTSERSFVLWEIFSVRMIDSE